MRILVVDDSSTMRRIVMNILGKLGYTDFVEAGNGLEAMEKLVADPVDFIITDWNMPKMNGLDMARAVRASELTRHIPVLMVTTNAAPEHITQAMQAGVTNYVLKPFTAETLRDRMQLALKAAQAA